MHLVTGPSRALSFHLTMKEKLVSFKNKAFTLKTTEDFCEKGPQMHILDGLTSYFS